MDNLSSISMYFLFLVNVSLFEKKFLSNFNFALRKKNRMKLNHTIKRTKS